MNQKYNNIGKFNSIYRGFVVWNDDPAVKGRLKIFVPGIYSDEYSSKPEMLPWACPAMSAFGGNSINPNYESDGLLNEQTGWSMPPHAGDVNVGAQCFVFFEGGDINYPIYFAFAQSGNGWLSEHPNQHVFKSDNVRVRIDQNVKDDRSTCKFDSYNSNNSKIAKTQLQRDCIKYDWTYDHQKGNIKQLQTRIDIQVMAEKLNAVNLNIHGNVNVKIQGDWFVQHIGNKYQYHKGDTYIKQDGSTYIQQQGTVREKLTGNKSIDHTGNYYVSHNGDVFQTHSGTYFMIVDGDVTYTFNSQYKISIGKNYTETVNENKSVDIFGNKSINVIGNYNEIVTGDRLLSTEGAYDLLVGQSITQTSYRGNILLQTTGDFELMDDGKITQKGFTNIGTKGNIQLISTFGNINLQCKNDDSKADFSGKTIVIPWNPSFVYEVEKLATTYPAFSKTDAILGADALNSEVDFSSFDISKFITLFKQFITSFLIYDGLPVFLPTRMIVQNPNIPTPKNQEDLSWIPQFRSEASDWRDISSSDYWKLPGRMMGNINIETWSGDINIKTNSTLGCAGNINIQATESAGTLPGYKIGTVNIKNSGTKRIYPDPRDLFLDSDFTSRVGGQFTLFKHGTNFTDLTWRRSVLPDAASSILQSLLGCSFNWVATDYDKFYDLYGLSVLTHGSLGALSANGLLQLQELKKQDAPKLGCTKCITDYLLGLPGIQDLCYATQDLTKFGSDGIHSYGFWKFNPLDRDNPRGTFNILSLDFDKISMGDGHAIDMGFIDRQFTGSNIGAFNINCSGDFNQNIGRNYSLAVNTSTEHGKKTTSYTYTQKYYDDVWPSVLKNFVKGIDEIWNSSIGLLISLVDGDIKILGQKAPILKGVITFQTGFKFLDFPLPENKFLTLGYTVTSKQILGDKITSQKTEGNESAIDFGFEFKDTYKLLTGQKTLNDLKILFTDHDFIKTTASDSINQVNQKNDNKTFSLSLKSPFDFLLNTNKSYGTSFKSDGDSDVRSGYDEFNLTWSLDKSSVYYFPDYYWKTFDTSSIVRGHGYSDSRNLTSYRFFTWNKEEELKSGPVAAGMKSYQQPAETYVDYNQNIITSTKNQTYAQGQSRNIIINHQYLTGNDQNISITHSIGNDIIISDKRNAGRNIQKKYADQSGRSITENITYKSPINTKTVTLQSVSYFHDEDTQTDISVNNYSLKMIGNGESSGQTDWKVTKQNTFVYDANSFINNEIFINNGKQTDGSLNKIQFNNGIESNNSSNQLVFNSGNNTQNSKNNYFIFNGLKTINSSNQFKVSNGSESTIGQNGKVQNWVLIQNGINSPLSNNLYFVENGTQADNSNNIDIFYNGHNSKNSKNSFISQNGLGYKDQNTIIEAENSVNTTILKNGRYSKNTTNSFNVGSGQNSQASNNSMNLTNGSAAVSSTNSFILNNGINSQKSSNTMGYFNGVGSPLSNSNLSIDNGTFSGIIDPEDVETASLTIGNGNSSTFIKQSGYTVVDKQENVRKIYCSINQDAGGGYLFNAMQVEIGVNTTYSVNVNADMKIVTLGTATIGGSTTNITGVSTLAGTLNGNATWAITAGKAGSAPNGAGASQKWDGKSGIITPSTSEVTVTDGSSHSSSSSSDIKFTITKIQNILTTYLDYLKTQFGYLTNIFKDFDDEE